MWQFSDLFAGCTNAVDESLVDRSFLTQRPCSAPCWYELQLDKSTDKDVYATLRQLAFVDQSAIQKYESVGWGQFPGATEIQFDCARPKGRGCGVAVLSENRLKAMLLFIQYHLTFEMVVQQLGTPDYISYFPGGAEELACTTSLYWPEKLVFVASSQRKNCPTWNTIKQGIKVDPSAEVTSINYVVRAGFKPGIEAGLPYISWPGFAKP